MTLTLGAAALKKAATRAAVEVGESGLKVLRSEARDIMGLAANQVDDAGRKLFVHHVNPLSGHPGGMPTLFPTLGLASFRNSKLNLMILTHAPHVATHRTLRFQEKIFSSFVMKPHLTGIRFGRNAGMFLLDSAAEEARKCTR